jgi:lipopolysaccharide transport system permease protein
MTERSTTTVIEPPSGWMNLNLGELWAHRELVYFLVWREIKVRYKQTALGAAWAIMQPLFTMLIFSLFFGRLAKMPSDGAPYPVFVLVALVPWTFFANGMGQAANSLVNSANLVGKIYFPRLAVPIGSVLAALVDFAVAFSLVAVALAWYRIMPSAAMLALPFLVLLVLTLALGTGFWLAALNVEYRDIRYVVPFLTQLWMFATPIAYPSSLLPEKWRILYGLNPMVGVIEGFRWAMLGTGDPAGVLAVSAGIAVVLLVSGAYYFRRMEQGFADVI